MSVILSSSMALYIPRPPRETSANERHSSMNTKRKIWVGVIGFVYFLVSFGVGAVTLYFKMGEGFGGMSCGQVVRPNFIFEVPKILFCILQPFVVLFYYGFPKIAEIAGTSRGGGVSISSLLVLLISWSYFMGHAIVWFFGVRRKPESNSRHDTKPDDPKPS